MYSVPDSAPTENKAICDLINQGLDPKQLYKAAYTFYRCSLEEALISKPPVRVQSGLFRGMVLFPGSFGSQLLPKWMGTYEAEVQTLLRTHARDASCFINIGCAEGFYLSGIAQWLQIPCFGTDLDPRSQQAVQHSAAHNALSHLVQFCPSTQDAVAGASGNLLCLVDVDGNELAVLNELQQWLPTNQNIRTISLILETDRDTHGQHNTPVLIDWLCAHGWQVQTIAQQNPHLRFEGLLSDQSFLDQVAHGAEGRPGGQAWIFATHNRG